MNHAKKKSTFYYAEQIEKSMVQKQHLVRHNPQRKLNVILRNVNEWWQDRDQEMLRVLTEIKDELTEFLMNNEGLRTSLSKMGDYGFSLRRYGYFLSSLSSKMRKIKGRKIR